MTAPKHAAAQPDGQRADPQPAPGPDRADAGPEPPRRQEPGAAARWRLDRAGAPIVLVLVLIAGSAVFGGSFSSGRNLGNIALDSSYLLLIATGMTFVILSGGIDLSVGSLLALSGVLTAYGARWGSLTAVVLPLAVCAAFGVVNGLLIGRARIAPFIVTLAALLFARGLAFAVADEGNKVYIIPAGLGLTRLGQARWLGLGAPVWLAVAMFAVGAVALNLTRFGQAVYAVGDNQEAAELMGLPVARVRIVVYVLSAVLTGLAGVLVAAQTQSGLPTIGEGRELEAIAAVVIGGTLLAGGAGSLSGTLAGVLLLKVIQNLINQVGTLTAYYQQVVSGTFLVVVVLAQSRLARRRFR